MSDVLFSASGSHWGQPELNHFHVVDAGPFGWLPRLSKNGLKELKEHRLRVGDETARRLQSVIGEVTGNEWSRYNCETHRDLLLQGGKVQLGQFFTNLATVAQSWRLGDADSETSPLPVRRPIRSVQQRIRDPRILTGKPLEAAYSRILYPSTPDGRADVMEAQGATPQEIAAEREKPETITNAMILSFLESVLEFSKLRERMVAQAVKSKLARPQERMEWHLVPTPFSIAALECKCSSTNDGSLFFKRITYVNGSAQWKNASGLVYCSIETKAMHKVYTDEGEHLQSVQVRAQEASQMIGMMCQRIAERKLSRGRAFQINDLDQYSRTTFLISCTQTAVLMKAAYFSLEYIEYHRLGETPPEIPRKQKERAQEAITPTKASGVESQMRNLSISSSDDEGSGGTKGKGKEKSHSDPIVAKPPGGATREQKERAKISNTSTKRTGAGRQIKKSNISSSGVGGSLGVTSKGKEKSYDDPVAANSPVGVESQGKETSRDDPVAAKPPKLTIETTQYFSFRNGDQAVAAANQCIAIVEYLENKRAVFLEGS